jgi:hypothetical protein
MFDQTQPAAAAAAENVSIVLLWLAWCFRANAAEGAL